MTNWGCDARSCPRSLLCSGCRESLREDIGRPALDMLSRTTLDIFGLQTNTGRLGPPSRWLQAGSSLKDCLTITDCITFQDSIPTGHVLRFRSNLLPHRFTSDKELRNQLCRKLISKLTSSLQTSSICLYTSLYIQHRYRNGIVMVQ